MTQFFLYLFFFLSCQFSFWLRGWSYLPTTMTSLMGPEPRNCYSQASWTWLNSRVMFLFQAHIIIWTLTLCLVMYFDMSHQSSKLYFPSFVMYFSPQSTRVGLQSSSALISKLGHRAATNNYIWINETNCPKNPKLRSLILHRTVNSQTVRTFLHLRSWN